MAFDRRTVGLTSVNRRVIQALDEALALEGKARAAWLAALTESDPILAGAIRELLAQDEAAHDIIPTQPPTLEGGGAWLEPPDHIGPYRVVEVLGMGGMGAVWKGERDDGLFDQTVAIKLIKPGLISPSAATQFAAERRLLARLRHPNIAQLFDGGADDLGRAYFVMELVEGTPLTQYAQAHQLTPREAARLLLPVCAAVQHAHQHLVVHADIKPGNIMVDHEGRPKLLDFGIARNLSDRPDQTPGVGFTQGYASPQRLAGEPPAPPDDVYALGVVLYQLVTGQRPPDIGTPPRAGETLRTAAEPALRLRARDVGEDLEAVIAKATAPLPADRYDSVGALSEDIRRWVERRPVRALPMTWRRTIQKGFERRPVSATAGVAALILLIGAFTAVTALYFADKRARAVAEARFADVRYMAHYLLFDVYDKLSRTPKALPVRQDVAAVGQKYLDRLSVDGSAPEDLRLEAAEGLLRLALIQGGGHGRNLGKVGDATRNLDKVIALTRKVTADNPKSVEGWRLLSEALLEQATLGADQGSDPKAADQVLQDSKKALDTALALAPADPALLNLQIDWRLQLSGLRQWQENYPESIAAAKAATQAIDALPPALRGSDQAQIQKARAYDALAETTYYMGDEAGSEAPYTRQREILEALYKADPTSPDRIRALSRANWALGTTLLTLRRADEALRELDPGVGLAKANLDFDPDDVQAQRTLRIIKFARAQALSAASRHDQAIAAMSELLTERRKLFDAAPASAQAERDYVVGQAALADIYAAANRKPQACAAYAQSLTTFADMKRKGWMTPFDESYSKARVVQAAGNLCGAK